MSKKSILIVYASNSGSTFQVAEQLESMLSKKHTVVVQKARESAPDDLDSYDLILLGTPSWWVNFNEGSPHESVLLFMQACMNKKSVQHNFALFGCGDRSYTHFCGAVDELESFVKKVGGTLVVPSLKIDSYYFEQKTAREQVEQWGKILLKTV